LFLTAKILIFAIQWIAYRNYFLLQCESDIIPRDFSSFHRLIASPNPKISTEHRKFCVSLQLCLLWIKIFKYEEYTHPFDDLLADLSDRFCVRTVRCAREMGLQDSKSQ
jgi:hypothetical protein